MSTLNLVVTWMDTCHSLKYDSLLSISTVTTPLWAFRISQLNYVCSSQLVPLILNWPPLTYTSRPLSNQSISRLSLLCHSLLTGNFWVSHDLQNEVHLRPQCPSAAPGSAPYLLASGLVLMLTFLMLPVLSCHRAFAVLLSLPSMSFPSLGWTPCCSFNKSQLTYYLLQWSFFGPASLRADKGPSTLQAQLSFTGLTVAY